MSRTAISTPSSFPKWVTLCSLGLVLWLFFSNTVPAVRERDFLLALEDNLGDLRQDYDAAIEQARLGNGAAAEYDLQSLFVAIDKKGFTPAEFCAAYPSSSPDSSQSGAPDGSPSGSAETGEQARAKFR